MAKKRRIRQAFKRGKAQARRLKPDEVDPALLASLEVGLGKKATAGDAQQLQTEMLSKVLQSMVELRLAQWLDAVLRTLRDKHGFDEIQLSQFAREFRKLTSSDGEISPDGRVDNGQESQGPPAESKARDNGTS